MQPNNTRYWAGCKNTKHQNGAKFCVSMQNEGNEILETPILKNVAKFRHSMQKRNNHSTICVTFQGQQVCPSHVEVSCPNLQSPTSSSSKIATILSWSDTLLSSVSLVTANRSISRPSSSSSHALSAPCRSAPIRCWSLLYATDCYGPGLGASFGFLGAGSGMGAAYLGGGGGGGGGGGAGFATSFPGLVLVWVSAWAGG